MTTDAYRIRGLLAEYEAALRASDAEAVVRLWAPDGVFLPQGQPTRSGDELLAAYQSTFDAVELDIDFTVEHLAVDGDMAHAVTHSAGKVTILADGTVLPEENRSLFLFGRRDGDWKIISYMFNKADPDQQAACRRSKINVMKEGKAT